MPTLLGIQVAKARHVQIGGRDVLTAIYKSAVSRAVLVHPTGLEGDEQGDLSAHGGLERAVYAYPSEHYTFWEEARARTGHAEIDDALLFGSMGENLTLQGVLEHDVWVGDVLRFEQCELRVTRPRLPCYKFNAAMGYSRSARDMTQHGCCGWYLAVQRPGQLREGESFVLMPGPRHLSIKEAFAAKQIKPTA